MDNTAAAFPADQTQPPRILITGATSGLGRAMAEALAGTGAHVVITGRDPQRAARAAGQIDAGRGRVHGIGMDVRDEQAVTAGVARAVELLGGGPDMLVNNAGLGMRTVNPDFMTSPRGFWEVPADGFRAVVDTNLTGYFLVARAVVPLFLAAGGGRIVNISLNEETMVRRGFTPYGPSRAGSEALSRIMAADLRDHGIWVNVLLPGGATRTGMIIDPVPAGLADRLLDASVMAEPIRWLCSPAAEGVTDQRIVARDFDAWLREHGSDPRKASS
ncbi:SDR family NAD(P)-dependent oxidoreductase [Actinoplanes sp. N902-109]|uniref:SDR family NAD(P)-dependent oxidoreductase n=1 Tax=Actinoplanes sp. (strain N902-109) TaxID=649831 RepID=UPI0003296214|nr:SDR family oxidoreductase [Actinoplanes sp. N902-109]AGL19292.1 gluconate 5-dehydrogenase [Actinoplanes sp. N902-109]